MFVVELVLLKIDEEATEVLEHATSTLKVDVAERSVETDEIEIF
ncbi:hypothetical protein [Leptospira yasudae]|nr:hypothetical protein [Leptospira yasudae]